MSILAWIFLGLLILWLAGEIGLRLYVTLPLDRGFYTSIPKDQVRPAQERAGVQVSRGPGWVHLGWIADPDNERYRILQRLGEQWQEVGKAQFGTFLFQAGGEFQVVAVANSDGSERLVGQASVQPGDDQPPLYRPVIAGEWQTLFKPQTFGRYINDHTVYQDANGDWRLVGITSLTNGEYKAEKYFAVGSSSEFPPLNGMQEQPPIAGFDELAWAPFVLQAAEGDYKMFWSPHKLHQMDSSDGITWQNHRITLPAPYHRFFRDAVVLQVGPSQWLLYSTANGGYFSQIDVYQSFDLEGWQYIRTALRSNWRSERNAPFASMESPHVIEYQGRYYLSLTYNNDSFFWNGVLLDAKVWLDKASYNNTLVFHSLNPYDFGVYQGESRTSNLVARLEAHAPKLIYQPQQNQWYITTAGWPWVTTLTQGEVAVARLEWQPAP